MAYIPQPPPIPRNRDMAFYEERERMRKLAQKSSNMGTSGASGTSGNMGTSGDMGNPFKYDPNTFEKYASSGSTISYPIVEENPKKIKPNIQPILSEREKVKTSWKFWKK